MEPTDSEIETFIAVSDLTREEAIQWLKAYDNDPEKCANAWLDDPGSLQKKVRSAVEFDHAFRYTAAKIGDTAFSDQLGRGAVPLGQQWYWWSTSAM
ncbi:MAG: hypothetical protein LQ342_000685 [Letrouitia transgressa]|nr:MAG: hypothetical protein LQ342_000685 [Letrouitia transgressa]